MLYDVSVAAGSSQLGGQDIMAGTVMVEIQGTNYTGMYMTKILSHYIRCTLISRHHKSYYFKYL